MGNRSQAEEQDLHMQRELTGKGGGRIKVRMGQRSKREMSGGGVGHKQALSFRGGSESFLGKRASAATVSSPRCSGSRVGPWRLMRCRTWMCPSACVYEDVPTRGVCVCTSGVCASGVLPTGPRFLLPPSGLGSSRAQGGRCPAADSRVGAMMGEPVRG